MLELGLELSRFGCRLLRTFFLTSPLPNGLIHFLYLLIDLRSPAICLLYMESSLVFPIVMDDGPGSLVGLICASPQGLQDSKMPLLSIWGSREF